MFVVMILFDGAVKTFYLLSHLKINFLRICDFVFELKDSGFIYTRRHDWRKEKMIS